MTQEPTQPPKPPPVFHPGPTHTIEGFLSLLLTTSVLIAAFVTVFGATLYIKQHASQPINFSTYTPQPPELTSPGSILHNATRLNPQAILQLGVLLLIATPVARVFFSFINFVIVRDKLYALLTLIVLGALAIGLFSGIL